MFYNLTNTETLARLSTSIDKGLMEEEIADRQRQFGKNVIAPPAPTPFWKLVLKQFQDFLVIILLVAALVSFGLALFEHSENESSVTSFVEPFVILAILIVNAAVGVIQETNAEKAIAALKSYEAEKAAVIRSGRLREVHSSELVPGDIISVVTGNKIPADARVVQLQSPTLKVDQSILTGENKTVQKDEHPLKAASEHLVIQQRTNMIFSGTLVTGGKALAVVTQTGKETEFGKIATHLHENVNDESSPLKQKLDEFGEKLSKMIGLICILVWIINIGHFADPERGGMLHGAVYYFKIAVALAVAAVPEGLPAVVTTCLALGAREMAKEGAIVRTLSAVETLGCTTVIVSDKTGTITTNQMSVQKVLVITKESSKKDADASVKVLEFDVEGTSFTPKGKISLSGATAPFSLKNHPALEDVARISALCNESKLVFNEKTRKVEFLGEPTEAALRVLVEKLGLTLGGDEAAAETDLLLGGASPSVVSKMLSKCSEHWQREFPLEAMLEFTRERKSMSAVCKPKTNGPTKPLFCKGAPHVILNRCVKVRLDSGGTIALSEKVRTLVLENVERLGKVSRFRCLALAQGEVPVNASFLDPAAYESLESNMTLIGVVAIVDPPRPQALPSIVKCQEAGIRVVMCTGDDGATAEAIARQVGLLRADQDDHAGLVQSGYSLSGEEWTKLDEAKKRDAVQRVKVMYRVEPKHKLALVEILREGNEVVAMTGDGVNDAPALKCADIGIAMGSGTSVAKEAADMVLADDNIATIVSAVRQGRTIFANTKQFIRYLVSSNLGEVVCIFLAAALQIPETLLPVQLLWVNLVTDGLPATALSFNPPDPDIMKRKPRSKSEPIVNRWTAVRFVVIGLYVGLAVVIGFVWWFTYFEGGPQMTFNELRSFQKCGTETHKYTCAIFKRGNPEGLDRASTVALSILVVIEMFNALNAISETQSLLVVPPWINRHLIVAISVSLLLQAFIVYVPMFAVVFGVAPLTFSEWMAVFWISLPVVFIDEFMKLLTRRMIANGNLNGPTMVKLAIMETDEEKQSLKNV